MKRLGFTLLLVSALFYMLFETAYYIPYVIHNYNLMEYYDFLFNQYTSHVMNLSRLLMILGVVMLLKDEKMSKRLIIGVIMTLFMSPYLLNTTFNNEILEADFSNILLSLSIITGYLSLTIFEKRVTYLVVTIQFTILLLIDMAFRFDFDVDITFYFVMNAFLPIGIFLTLIIGSLIHKKKVKFNSETVEERLMQYCRKCGKTTDEEHVICQNCGFDYWNGNNFCQECGSTTDEGQKMCVSCKSNLIDKVAYNKKMALSSEKDFGFTVLGFLVPLIGFIIYLVMKDNEPVKSTSAGKGALIGFILGSVSSIFIYVMILAESSMFWY